MKNEDLEVGVFESHSAYEEQRRWRGIFHVVVAAYRDVFSCSPVIASNPDETAKSRRLGPSLIEYKVDVLRQTRRALKSDDLFEVWRRLVEEEDESISKAVIAKIATACGKAYEKSGLEPIQYFRFFRKGRPDRRPITNEVAA
jgi:hypothetical protein